VHFIKREKTVIFWQTPQLNAKSASDIGSLNQPLRSIYT
jgi:hypothetical protein